MLICNEDYRAEQVAPVRVYARYDESLDEPQRHNVYAAGLPLNRSVPQILKILTRRPNTKWLSSTANANSRLTALDTTRRHFVPLTRSVHLAQSIKSLLWAGYDQRLPIDGHYHLEASKRREAALEALHAGEPQRTDANSLGGCLVGPPGVGKSSVTNMLMHSIPQVIVHRLSKADGAIFKQLTYVALDAPANGSIRAMCLGFLRQADQLLGTEFASRSRGDNTEELILRMGTVADLQGLGLLIIDHAENLVSKRETVSSETIRNLTRLTNTVGVPLFFIGAPESNVLFDVFPSLGRRVATHSHTWNPLECDEEWKEFTKRLLQLQVLPQKMPWSQVFASALWEESQGVPHYANLLFFKMEERAIRCGQRQLSEADLSVVAAGAVPTIQDGLKRIRKRRASDRVDGGDPQNDKVYGRARKTRGEQ